MSVKVKERGLCPHCHRPIVLRKLDRCIGFHRLRFGFGEPTPGHQVWPPRVCPGWTKQPKAIFL